jgi:hypothetical protein
MVMSLVGLQNKNDCASEVQTRSHFYSKTKNNRALRRVFSLDRKNEGESAIITRFIKLTLWPFAYIIIVFQN